MQNRIGFSGYAQERMCAMVDSLVLLARSLGEPSAGLAMLAEGNVSGRATPDTFWVKASGQSMGRIEASGFVEVRSEPILAAMQEEILSDEAVRRLLAVSRVDDQVTVMPSVETFMHAYLLGLPNVQVVAHTHPEPLLALLSTVGSEHLAAERLFPDEVVCCGHASCWVPYIDPGLPLAVAIRDRVEAFLALHGEYPKTIWMENHGLIALGASVREAESATLMSAKAARVRIAALSSGRPIHPLSPDQIGRIHTRPDEHYRQRQLRGQTN